MSVGLNPRTRHGSDIQASIPTCSALLSMKIPQTWAKAVDDRRGLILEQLGVQHVISPEKDLGKRIAHLGNACAAPRDRA